MDLICIAGPTATGKTLLGVELALALGGEVVSCDSMQLYRGMDIGTAKVTAGEMRGVPHYMIDVAEPGEDYSVSRYTQEAEACLQDIAGRGKPALVVGGTALYMDSLVRGGDYSDRPAPELRAELTARAADEAGRTALWEELRRVDPEAAEKTHPNNAKRLVRALEIWHTTGETITAHDRRDAQRPPKHRALRIILSYADRAALYERIDRRVDQMMEQGLVAEVERLLAAAPSTTALQAIGYKEIAAALRSECTMEAAVDAVKRESRRYAKRQLTWLRRHEDALWLQVDTMNFEAVLQASTEYLRSRGVGC